MALRVGPQEVDKGLCVEVRTGRLQLRVVDQEVREARQHTGGLVRPGRRPVALAVVLRLVEAGAAALRRLSVKTGQHQSEKTVRKNGRRSVESSHSRTPFGLEAHRIVQLRPVHVVFGWPYTIRERDLSIARHVYTIGNPLDLTGVPASDSGTIEK